MGPPGRLPPPPADLLATEHEWRAYRTLVDRVEEFLASSDQSSDHGRTTGAEEGDSAAAEISFLTPYCLRRYLRARQFNVDRAWSMLHASLVWRRSTRPERLRQSDVQDVHGLGTVFMAGHDRLGRPVVYMKPGAHNPYAPERRVAFMVWVMEFSIAATDERGGVEKLVWVLDFIDFGQRVNDSASRQTSRETLDILQNQYPERLGCALLINPPWYFRLLYTMLSPFMDAVTKEKVRMVSGDASTVTRALTDVIAPEMLLERYGGTLANPLTAAGTQPST